MTRYINSSDKGELSDNQIRCVLEDDFKHIWVGTFRGLDCYDPTIDKWEHYTRYGDSPNTLSHHSVYLSTKICKVIFGSGLIMEV